MRFCRCPGCGLCTALHTRCVALRPMSRRRLLIIAVRTVRRRTGDTCDRCRDVPPEVSPQICGQHARATSWCAFRSLFSSIPCAVSAFVAAAYFTPVVQHDRAPLMQHPAGFRSDCSLLFSCAGRIVRRPKQRVQGGRLHCGHCVPVYRVRSAIGCIRPFRHCGPTAVG